MEHSYEKDHFLFSGQTDPVITYSDAVVPATTVQLLEVRHLSQALRGLNVGNQFLNSFQEGLVLQGSKVLGKACFEANFQCMPSSRERTSPRLTSSVRRPSSMARASAISSRVSSIASRRRSLGSSSTSTRAVLKSAFSLASSIGT